MPDQQIDAIKVRLGVDTSSIEAGVNAANTQLNKLSDKTRIIKVKVEAVRGASSGQQSLATYLKKAREGASAGIKVPVSIQAAETGEFGVGKMRTRINEALSANGGINVPIHVKLSASDAAAIRKDISTQIGQVDIYFNWVAKNAPKPPEGGSYGTGDASPGGGGNGPRSGGGAPAAAPAGRGRQPGETKADASIRHKAEHAAENARKQADAAAIKTAEAQTKAARQEADTSKREEARAAGTGSRPRPPKTATGAPATGTATAGAAASGSYVPHTGTPLPGTRFAKHNYRTSDAPRGLGHDKPYGPGLSAGLAAGQQHLGESRAQSGRERDMAEFVQQMQSAGVNPMDPAATTAYMRSIKGKQRRGMFVRLGLPGQGDPLGDPQAMSAFMGRLQESAQLQQTRVENTEGGTVNRKAGNRGRRGEGGKAGGGGEMIGTLGTATGAPTRADPIDVPGFHQGYIEQAATQVDAVTERAPGAASTSDFDYPSMADARAGAASRVKDLGGGLYGFGKRQFTSQGAAEEAAGKANYERQRAAAQNRRALRIRSMAEQAHAKERDEAIAKIAKQQASAPLTAEQRKLRDQRVEADTGEAAAKNKQREKIRAQLIAQGLPAGVIADRIEAILAGKATVAGTKPVRRSRKKPVAEAAPGSTVADYAAQPLDVSAVPEFGFSQGGKREPFKFPARQRKIEGLADGGLYSRPFGERIAAEGHKNVATENSYEWKKARAAQLKRQPFCSHCGIGLAEARRTGIKMSADHITSQAGGGDPFDPANLQTLCVGCNSRKAHMSGNPSEIWQHARPGAMSRHPKLSGATKADFLPGGIFFGVKGIADALRRLKTQKIGGMAEGGYVKHGGLLQRMAQAGHAPSIKKFGEHGEELGVTDPNTGETEIVPHHKMPQWLERAQQGHGFGKDLTGYAEGGETNFTFRGKTGFTKTPHNVVGAVGQIQRVFVVNFPAAYHMAGSAPAMSSPNEPAAAASKIGDAVGSMVDKVAGKVKTTTAKAPAASLPSTASERERAQLSPASGRISPLEKSRLELTGIRSDISERQSIAPVRALSVSVGQIFSQLSGRAGIVARAREASTLADFAGQRGATTERLRARSRAQAVELKAINDFQKEGNTLTDKQLEKQAALTKEIKNRGGLIRQSMRDEKSATDAARKATDKIVTPAAAIKNIFASAAGISVGTLAFSAAFGALNMGVEAFADVSEKAIERATGWHNVAAKVTDDLSDQTRAANGATKQVLALSDAHTGLSAAASASLTARDQRVQTEAGNKAITDQIAQLHAARAVNAQGALPGGYDRGLVETTGGLNLLGLQTNIGGVPSFYEQFGNELKSNNAVSGQAAAPTGPEKTVRDMISAMVEGGGGGNPFTTGVSALWNISGGANGPMGPTGALGENMVNPVSAQASEANKAFSESLMTDIADAAKRGGGKLNVRKADTDALMAQQKEQTDLLSQSLLPGLRDFGEALKSSGTVIDGTFDSLKDLQKYLLEGGKAATRGAAIPDPKLLIEALKDRIIPAQVAGIRREGRYEREVANPAQTALRYAARPMVPFMDPRQFPSEGGKAGQGGSADYEKAFKSYAGVALPAQKAITAEIQKGDDAIKAMAKDNPELLTTVEQIRSIGADIQKIQLGSQQKQLNLQVAEYNNQLRIARRSLQDAKDFMAGMHGAAGDTLGALEGQNAAISRQLQLLQQEMTQRQINFKLATAGFVAPGTTPEERAARIEEAKKEAEFAQKQLDLQKQLSANQYKGVGISAGRDVTDLQAQIGLLEQGKAVTIDTAAAQAAIEALQEQQDILIEKAGSYMGESQKIAGLWMSTWTDIQAQSGEFMVGLGQDLATAFGGAGAAFVGAIMEATQSFGGGVIGAYAGGGNGPGTGAGHYATGYSGYHSTPTTMTVGDAGGEEVAVLRNPRRVMVDSSSFGGGGGGGSPVSIQINVTGDTKDPEVLAATIARKVEETMMRKTSLFGLRRA